MLTVVLQGWGASVSQGEQAGLHPGQPGDCRGPGPVAQQAGGQAGRFQETLPSIWVLGLIRYDIQQCGGS